MRHKANGLGRSVLADDQIRRNLVRGLEGGIGQAKRSERGAREDNADDGAAVGVGIIGVRERDKGVEVIVAGRFGRRPDRGGRGADAWLLCGACEAGAIPVGPLFAQAIEDALGLLPRGIELNEIPLSPNRLFELTGKPPR